MSMASLLALSILNCWTVIIYRGSSFLFPLELAARERNVLVLGDDFSLSLATAFTVVVILGENLHTYPLKLVCGFGSRG